MLGTLGAYKVRLVCMAYHHSFLKGGAAKGLETPHFPAPKKAKKKARRIRSSRLPTVLRSLIISHFFTVAISRFCKWYFHVLYIQLGNIGNKKSTNPISSIFVINEFLISAILSYLFGNKKNPINTQKNMTIHRRTLLEHFNISPYMKNQLSK